MKTRLIKIMSLMFAALFLLGSNCDTGLEPRFTSISGDLIIDGEWPEEAVLCFVVVTNEKPEELVLDQSLLKGYFQFPDEIIEEEWDSTHFEFDLNPDTYNWVFVAILDSAAIKDPENSLGWRNLATEYTTSDEPPQLKSVTVGEDEQPFIKMKIDFDTPYQGVGNPGYFHLEG